MSLRIVTHCYAERLPFFADLLKFHLTSISHSLYEFPLRVEILCTSTDTKTLNVLNSFSDSMRKKLSARILDPTHLWRRAIGRNIAALSSTEDFVWFCDVDYVFSPLAIATICRALREKPEAAMLYPSVVSVSKDHKTGDATIAQAEQDKTPEIDTQDFVPSYYSRAIGGAQIVPGKLARTIGYLDKTKWMTPSHTPFPDTRDDIAARRQYAKHGPLCSFMVGGIYRIRHSTSSYR